MAKAMDHPVERLPPKEDGFIGKRVRFFVDIFFWVLLALVISILIEWLGIFFRWWDLSGSSHSVYMLNTEIAWLNKDFHTVLGSPAESSLRFSRFMYETLFVWFNKDLAQSLINADILSAVSTYLKSSVTTIQLFFVRLTIISFALPVFVVFGLAAFIDGLMVRDLRRFGGDRESAWVWHSAASWLKPLVATPFVIYLTSPWSIHPNWVILPFVSMLALALWLVSSKFKKYA